MSSPSTDDDTPLLVPYQAADGYTLIRDGQDEEVRRAEEVYADGKPLPRSAFTTDGRLAPSWQAGPAHPPPKADSYENLWNEKYNEKTGETFLKALPEAFVERLTDDEPFIALTDTQMLYHYVQGMYNGHSLSFIRRWVEDRFHEKGITSTRRFVEEVYAAVTRRTYVDRADVNPPGMFCLQNGILDLTGPSPLLRPFDPGTRFLFRLPSHYDPEARCPRFLSILEGMLPDGADRDLLQEAFGYVFVAGHPYKKAFFFLGPTNTGKSMLHELLRGVLGNENVSGTSLHDLDARPFSMAQLYGKLATVYSDLPPSHLRAVDKFLMSVGRDLIEAEHKFQDPFRFINESKLYYSANRTPSVKDVTDAFWDRWIILRFTHIIPPAQRVRHLADTLLSEETPGILNWMLEGRARLLAQDGFTVSQGAEQVRTVWKAQSAPWDSFAEFHVVADPQGRIPNPDLWAAYVAYCEDMEVPPDRSQAWITHHMADYFPYATLFTTNVTEGEERHHVKVWRGISLLPAGPQAAAQGGEDEGPPPAPGAAQKTLLDVPATVPDPTVPAPRATLSRPPGDGGAPPTPPEAPQNVANPRTAHPNAPEAIVPQDASKGLSWTLRLRNTFTLEEVLDMARGMGVDEARARAILEGLRQGGGLVGAPEGPFRWRSADGKGRP